MGGGKGGPGGGMGGGKGGLGGGLGGGKGGGKGGKGGSGGKGGGKGYKSGWGWWGYPWGSLWYPEIWPYSYEPIDWCPLVREKLKDPEWRKQNKDFLENNKDLLAQYPNLEFCEFN
jgi:hypothetical protein